MRYKELARVLPKISVDSELAIFTRSIFEGKHISFELPASENISCPPWNETFYSSLPKDYGKLAGSLISFFEGIQDHLIKVRKRLRHE